MSSRRPYRDTTGPQPEIPACPPHLQGEAREEWQRMGERLFEHGLLTEIDGPALALYCQAWERWVEAEENLRKYGVVIKSPNNFPMPSPYLAIANQAMAQMIRLLAEFGMSPSSRSRVTKAVPQLPAGALKARIVPEVVPVSEDPRLLTFLRGEKRTGPGMTERPGTA
jgi:P27 family predicted phage terminase small subunit